MFATVYRVRQRGVRLPRPLPGVSGVLVLQPAPDGADAGSLRAKLLDETTVATARLPELHGAKVERITTNGIKISGTEVIARRDTNKSSADHHIQTWWVLVHTSNLGAALDLSEMDQLFSPAFPSTAPR